MIEYKFYSDMGSGTKQLLVSSADFNVVTLVKYNYLHKL